MNPDQRSRVLGIVLTGGEARRMGGVDKTAIEIEGVAIVDRVKRALATTCDRVVVVGPEARGGPAAAVVSVGDQLSQFDIAVVAAGDLALLRDDHVAALLHAVGGHDAVAAIDDRGLPNPLLAAHRAEVLRRTLAAIEPGARADELLPSTALGVSLDADATFSVNTPGDLEEARRRLRSF